jgi:hypothetical protein
MRKAKEGVVVVAVSSERVSAVLSKTTGNFRGFRGVHRVQKLEFGPLYLQFSGFFPAKLAGNFAGSSAIVELASGCLAPVTGSG